VTEDGKEVRVRVVTQERGQLYEARGLFQGSLPSTMLFNIFIDDLLQGIHEEFATAENTHPAVMYANNLFAVANRIGGPVYVDMFAELESRKYDETEAFQMLVRNLR